MQAVELRRRVGAILAAEESNPTDWALVHRLSDELQRQLLSEPCTNLIEIVNYYLDDTAIREGHEAHGKRQLQRIRRFVETGDFENSKPVPLWACAAAMGLLVALVIWLVG